MIRPHPPLARHGTITVLVSILLVVLVGMAALALDGGLLQDNKRRVQSTADAAALAAATALYKNTYSVTADVPDPSGSAASAAQTTATANGFTNDGTTSVVTVNIPPKSGPFKDKTYYAEVYVTYNQPRYFSTIWGTTSLPVVARSVAYAKWGGTGNGVIVLDPTASNALDANGNGSATVTGGAYTIVNSNSTSAARTSGGGSLTSTRFQVTGDTVGTFNGPVDTGTPPIPDPLRYLPVPSVPPAGTITQVSLTQGNHQYTLTPGRYTNLPGMNSGDVVILQQASANSAGGIYYLDGCGFQSTGATVIMDPTTSGGVMLYNAPNRQVNSQGISITGNPSGTVNLSALTSGPYAGILFWQERSSTIGLNISGNGNFSLKGTFYAANALLTVSGNGSATIGSQYISRLLNITGGGNITIDYTENGTARERGVYLVE